MDYICLNNIQIYAHHGVLKQERVVGNMFSIDLKMGIDLHKACQSDKLEDTVNYAAVFQEIQLEMQTPGNLLEFVAERICNRLKNNFKEIQSIEIKLTKRNPPMTGQLDSVSVCLSR